MKHKILLVVLLLFLFIPSVCAKGSEDYDLKNIFNWDKIAEKITSKFNWDNIGDNIADSFQWDNIGEEIADTLFNFIIELVNAPLQPLLDAVKTLLEMKIDITLFKDIWAIMCYTISIFYGLLFLYSGFRFITSGADPFKREKAKLMLKNLIIMIVLINASYFIYEIIIQTSSLLTEGVMGLINPNFFNLVSGNIESIALEFFFAGTYILILILTLLILSIRYIIVAFGVAFFPIGLLLYYIEPVKQYGKLILNFLGATIFMTFFDALILLISSRLIGLDFFTTYRILLVMSAFGLCNLLMLYLMFFAAIKSAFKSGGKIAAIAVKYGKYLA